MKLSDILAGAPVIRQSAPPGLEISSVAYDSREAGPGALFVAIPGFKIDGSRFVDAAAAAGAVAAVTEHWLEESPLPLIQVESARRVMALAAANFYGRPSEGLILTGVTGTNGKTTTTFMLDAILRAAGQTSGLLGGVQYRLDKEILPAKRTTPESVDMQRLLAEMLHREVQAATIEVSSHGIQLSRTDCLAFDVAVFTNLSREHLDLHGDMEAYFEIKRRLFTGAMPCGESAGGYSAPRAVINIDDPYGRRLAAELTEPVTFGRGAKAAVTAVDTDTGSWESSFTLLTGEGSAAIRLAMPGGYNVLNALGAAAAALALNLPLETVADGLNGFTGVPGRFELVEAEAPFKVVIDYAHNEDGLRQAIQTARSLTGGRVITVFGCPGERDREKRPHMGRTAGSLSDLSVLTTDDCYGEPPEDILNETEPGLAEAGGDYLRIADRREAIAAALSRARPGDIVLIAGKGHEEQQIMASGPVPFSDRATVNELLSDRSA